MASLGEIINRLEKLEPELRTVGALCASGCIQRNGSICEVGDWQVHTWDTDIGGEFTAGAMRRVKHNGEPFPSHVHKERAWIMCSQGEARVRIGDADHALKLGDFVVIEPNTPHEVYAESKICCVVFVTIPADKGYRHGNGESGNGEPDPGC